MMSYQRGASIQHPSVVYRLQQARCCCVRVHVYVYYLHLKHCCCLFVAVAYTLTKSVKRTHTCSHRKRHALLKVRDQRSTQRAKRYCRLSRGNADRLSDRYDVRINHGQLSLAGRIPATCQRRKCCFLPFADGTGCTPVYE